MEALGQGRPGRYGGDLGREASGQGRPGRCGGDLGTKASGWGHPGRCGGGASGWRPRDRVVPGDAEETSGGRPRDRVVPGDAEETSGRRPQDGVVPGDAEAEPRDGGLGTGLSREMRRRPRGVEGRWIIIGRSRSLHHPSLWGPAKREDRGLTAKGPPTMTDG